MFENRIFLINQALRGIIEFISLEQLPIYLQGGNDFTKGQRIKGARQSESLNKVVLNYFIAQDIWPG